MIPNVFEFPEQKKDENYLYTLQKAFDKYINQHVKMKIFGLIPIKVALIIQTAFNLLKNILIIDFLKKA